jgi:tripartite-type tricarboxylate transporter receptor subunit TctC
MDRLRRDFLRLATAAAALPILPRTAAAQAYPARPVRVIVGYPPGGPTDIFARMAAQWLSERFRQPFVIENRPGAGSTIGVQAVISAPADGYTLITLSTSAVISSLYYKNLNYNLIRDITPVCGISVEPLVMVVNPSVKATTVPEFIADAKASPGKFVMASVGNGTTPHMAGALFMMMSGVEMLHVPYQGAAPALTDLLAGRADVMFEAMPTLVGYLKSGKLRALGVGTASRSPVVPDVPTVGEFLPGYEAVVWFGVGAPSKTPVEIVERLNMEINAGLVDPALKGKLEQFGGTAMTGSPAEFKKRFVDDAEKWGKVIRALSAKSG